MKSLTLKFTKSNQLPTLDCFLKYRIAIRLHKMQVFFVEVPKKWQYEVFVFFCRQAAQHMFSQKMSNTKIREDLEIVIFRENMLWTANKFQIVGQMYEFKLV